MSSPEEDRGIEDEQVVSFQERLAKAVPQGEVGSQNEIVSQQSPEPGDVAEEERQQVLAFQQRLSRLQVCRDRCTLRPGYEDLFTVRSLTLQVDTVPPREAIARRLNHVDVPMAKKAFDPNPDPKEPLAAGRYSTRIFSPTSTAQFTNWGATGTYTCIYMCIYIYMYT